MIYINDIPSFREPEICELFIDDRIEKIELINGNTIQDYGRVVTGDSFALECIFTIENYLRLDELWTNRTKVTFTDESGRIWENMRLVLKKIRYMKKFPRYVYLTFELWRV